MNAPTRLKQLIASLVPQQLLGQFRNFPRHRTESVERTQYDCDWMVLRHLIPVGTHVVDVGANLGGTTRALAELVGETGRITCIEAMPHLHSLLMSNLRKLRLQQVEALGVAISSANGVAPLIVPKVTADGEHLLTARIGGYPREGETTLEVATETLDRLFAGCRPAVEMIVLDVVGHALHCLQGASELLRKVKPAWWVRIDSSPDQRSAPMHEVFALLERRGYRAYCFNGERLHHWHAEDGERASHAFFLTERHLKRLPVAWWAVRDERIAAAA